MKHLFLTISFACVFVSFYSCSNKPQQKDTEENVYVDPRLDLNMQRSHIDTAAVMHHVTEYLDLLKQNDIEGALNKLYEASGDTVVPISKEYKEKMRNIVTTFPVLSYHIDELLMYSETDTEVRYTIEFYEKAEDDPRPNTLQCVINPRRVGYYWFLTVADRTVETNYREN